MDVLQLLVDISGEEIRLPYRTLKRETNNKILILLFQTTCEHSHKNANVKEIQGMPFLPLHLLLGPPRKLHNWLLRKSSKLITVIARFQWLGYPEPSPSFLPLSFLKAVLLAFHQQIPLLINSTIVVRALAPSNSSSHDSNTITRQQKSGKSWISLGSSSSECEIISPTNRSNDGEFTSMRECGESINWVIFYSLWEYSP